MVKLSKILAVINILLAIIVLFTCYATIREYYDFLKPKGVISPDYLQKAGVLLIYALITLTNSVFFLFVKKTGWWLIVITAVIFMLASIYNVTNALIYTPSRHNLKTEILLALFYTLSSIVYLSTPVRRHFKISKNPD
ncbi:MAG: hypothetical protein ACO1PI_12845 [Bacteroidota bacterium]